MQKMNGNILMTTYPPQTCLEDIIADIPQHVTQFSCMVEGGCWKLSRPLDQSEWDEYSHLFGHDDSDPTPPMSA
ncbi:hypothetical protein [Pseudomonas phage vB_PseuGesM_254]|uniref:Uncharacterized protein n=1 Tax=Pseudomonas phage vB_PseuGesM_254 TaxID=3092638 RepID=A0AAX4G6M3_9CAUD|nr:hypothetical protein [Pseudomonas phage PseuGes_254]